MMTRCSLAGAVGLVGLLASAAGCRASTPPAEAGAPPAVEAAPAEAETAEAAAPEPIPTRPEQLGGLVMDVPEEWTRQDPESAMRLAQFLLPGPAGDVELVVFRFPAGAGSVEANLERWRGQIDGEHAPAREMQVGALAITTLDLTGTYVAAVRPGSPEHHDESDNRMLVAIVEGDGDTLYFKCVGPAASVTPWASAFEAALRSLRPS